MATLQDIAKIAGVSTATVSLALSNQGRISEDMRAKIADIARELGYTGRKSAALQTKTQSIGVLYIGSNVSTGKDYFQKTLSGICLEAARFHVNVVMIGIHSSRELPEPADIYEQIRSSGVAGVIVITAIPSLRGFDRMVEEQFPMVFIGNRKVAGRSEEFHTVASDNFSGGYAAVDYLLRLGHVHIAVASAVEPTPWEKERLNGYYAAMRDADLPAGEERILRIPAPFDERAACWRMFAEQPPTAVFALNAMMGQFLLRYIRSAGISVPDQLSLIVFDDSANFPHEHPPITVIRQDMRSLGTLSAKMMLDILEHEMDGPKQILISTELVERASCAPVSGLDAKLAPDARMERESPLD
jgi:LacI family transcriptional regulator/LacI family purine nucleotide synthesis repressor